MAQVKVSIICDDTRAAQQLVQAVQFLDHSVGEVIDKPREAYMHLDPKEPRIVLLAEPAEALNIAQAVQLLRKVNAAAPVVYLSRTRDFAVLREVYRSGVLDILHLPEELDQLDSVLEKARVQLRQSRRQREQQAAAGAGTGTIVSVYSGKGGSGTTFISVNLAQAIALNSSRKTLLIDLNLQFGGIHQLLDIRSERNLGDLHSVLKELTFSQLGNVLYRLDSSGLGILLSPNHPQEAENFRSEDIELLLAACRQYFDVILLDVPKELNEISISAISQSDQLLYVVNLGRPDIVRMQNVLDILDRYHLVREENVAIVINKFSRKSDVTRADLQKMTTLPVIGTISDDPKGNLQTCVNLGQPLLARAGEKGLKGPARDLLHLAGDLLGRLGGEKHAHLPKTQQPAG